MFIYKIKVGSIVIALDFSTPGLKKKMTEYFMSPSSKDNFDIKLKIHIFNRSVKYKIVPDSLFHAKRKTSKGFKIEGGIMNGRFNKNKNHWKLNIHPVLIETEASRVFEQIIYQAYVSAAGESYKSLPLIHSCGVIKNNRGYLFLGASEAGKSTVATLSSRYHVINDEITIADISGSSPMLVSTPFNGLFRNKKAGTAPLAGIFLLNKAPNHSIEQTQSSTSVKTIASQIIPPSGLENFINSDDYLSQIDISSGLCSAVPVYSMYFAKDDGFWDKIDKLMEY